MAGIFKAGDIIRAAEEIETRGEAFYQRLVDAIGFDGDSSTREVFEYLRDEEAKHREVFRAMGERLAPVTLPAWATEDEYVAYMSAMLDNHALFRDGETAGAGLVREEAIRMAMQFEKDTMFFFREMRELVPNSEKAAVDRCVDEERTHLIRLVALLA
ncbi:ferritin family protein [Desulfovibrio subterraneus]|uniref:Rubrerythrin n=1 Tax=Desulfovibrio subterraneus TaxID=2718620 RepID=A0A7J0BIS2_9BACT|nr:ferritin family protein [Desulfovibrio subterraneus]WBF67368.1 ferritin family protein [Desulfovibrio subterraneus]GFM33132.1 rubrerythrin [Desulfovibrio subterraneus]